MTDRPNYFTGFSIIIIIIIIVFKDVTTFDNFFNIKTSDLLFIYHFIYTSWTLNIRSNYH